MSEESYIVYALQDQYGFAFYIGCSKNVDRPNHHFQAWQKDVNPQKWLKIQNVLRSGAEQKNMIRIIASGLPKLKATRLEADIINEIGLENLTNIRSGDRLGSLKDRYEALCKWQLQAHKINGDSQAKICEEYEGVTAKDLDNTKREDSFGLWTRFLAEHPNWSPNIAIEAKYKDLCEWRLTPATRREVAERSEVNTSVSLNHIHKKNTYNLWDRFCEEYPEYANRYPVQKEGEMPRTI